MCLSLSDSLINSVSEDKEIKIHPNYSKVSITLLNRKKLWAENDVSWTERGRMTPVEVQVVTSNA